MPRTKLVKTLEGACLPRPPVWIMRQAGRYLPEYRELRTQAKDFVGFCLNPEMAAEATLQPLRRFNLDAAILFADILLIPMAFGMNLRFVPGEGPKLDPVSPGDNLDRYRQAWSLEKLANIGETVSRVRAELDPETALIGFAGSPWTVATYMVEGQGSRDKWNTRLWAWENPESFDVLLRLIEQATVEYLIMQVKAGAQVLKLFDSWADNLPPALFERVIITPTRRIINALREQGITCPIIGFPRGCGSLIKPYVAETGCTAIGLDQSQTGQSVDQLLPDNFPVQGNLDNALLCAGTAELEIEIERIIEDFSGRPHVFNLGHGITPLTPIAHMERLVKAVQGH
ncbi:MAG: uroporphyrinogen decarboxylase [Robiginitomaculum sp.]|nr:MAG: uroporphyrinogen decarboxylase [Robiginitomaculum sp.]